MNKLKMCTLNRADENYKKLSKMFPNAVTETIDENGEVVRAIDTDVLEQEISCKIVRGGQNVTSLHGLIRKSLYFLQIHQ